MFKVATIFTILGLLLGGLVFAVDFNLSPATGQFGLKQDSSVNIKINTADESINAAQAKIKFNPGVLEVKSISKDGSIFNFWLQEPEFSNADGVIEFIGGTTSGVSGASLQVLKINFVAKGVGSSEFSFIDGAVTASDGSGTNILDKSNGAKFTVSSSATVPSGESAPIATPIPVIRTPVTATGLPAIPIVSVPLYPNPDSWYNVVSQFTASWKLPPDISGISTAFNTNPFFTPPVVSEGLFESKTYTATTQDGIYYFHIRLQNNRGWGPTAHYRIAVDTQPPVPFKIDVKTGLVSDNPSPKFTFNTADSLSGIDRDDITINSEEPIVLNVSEYSLLPRQPGEYTIRVRVFDKAGNSIEDSVKVEILPIETPAITSINKKVIIGADNPLVVKGTTIVGANVVVTIEDKNKFLVLQNEAKTNLQGEWEFRLDRELRRGDYLVSVMARDSRGAVSFPTEPVKVKFVEKPVVLLFGLDITLRGLLVVLIIGGILTASWFYRKTLLRLARSQREAVIISRDMKNAFDTVKKDIDRMAGMVKNDRSLDEKELEVNVISKKIGDTLDKIEKYISSDIENLK